MDQVLLYFPKGVRDIINRYVHQHKMSIVHQEYFASIQKLTKSLNSYDGSNCFGMTPRIFKYKDCIHWYFGIKVGYMNVDGNVTTFEKCLDCDPMSDSD